MDRKQFFQRAKEALKQLLQRARQILGPVSHSARKTLAKVPRLADKAPKHLPHLAYNWISGVGAVLASVSFLTAVILLLISIIVGLPGPYVGVLVYVFLPPLVVLGLVLIPLGMWRQSRRRKRGEAEPLPHWPRIDLNDKRVRNGAIIFVTGTVLFVLASSVGTYQAYHYTESVGFCGKFCHTVMKPEYVTHQDSPHAIVGCTSCHVGPGAGWYAKSKIRGLSRAYQVLFSDYPRPVPTPISGLKPTEIECHQCHWPQIFFGGRRWVFHHYMYDEKNTYWPIDMIIHTGGGDPGIDQTGGIHWYMIVGYRIEFIARDEQMQDIPWVRATNRQTGETTVYQDQTHPLSDDEIAAATPRTMDCVDCHNRPAHIFRTADHAVDQALFLNQIDAALPYAKKTAVSAMTASYDNQDDAMSGIAAAIQQHYQNNPPHLEDSETKIEQAVQATQKRFADNIFPYMKTDWKVHPDNVHHLYFKACFRCHLGNHRSDSGKTIPHDCNTCHRIVAQGSGQRAETETSTAGLAFQHPQDIGGLWKQLACAECHTGGVMGAQGAPQPPSPAPPKPSPPSPKTAQKPAQKKAQSVYASQCQECHGANGQGNPAMRVAMPNLPDLSNPKVQASATDAQWKKAILDGKGKSMPPFKGKLSGLDPDQLVDYLRHFAQANPPAPAKPPNKTTKQND